MSGLGSGLINNIYDYEKLFYESVIVLHIIATIKTKIYFVQWHLEV